MSKSKRARRRAAKKRKEEMQDLLHFLTAEVADLRDALRKVVISSDSDGATYSRAIAGQEAAYEIFSSLKST